jgi:hypothetical protein
MSVSYGFPRPRVNMRGHAVAQLVEALGYKLEGKGGLSPDEVDFFPINLILLATL